MHLYGGGSTPLRTCFSEVGIQERERMMDRLNCLAQCTRGASAAEYALILAIIGAGIAAAAFFLGAEVATAINDAGSCIATEGSACP